MTSILFADYRESASDLRSCLYNCQNPFTFPALRCLTTSLPAVDRSLIYTEVYIEADTLLSRSFGCRYMYLETPGFAVLQ